MGLLVSKAEKFSLQLSTNDLPLQISTHFTQFDFIFSLFIFNIKTHQRQKINYIFLKVHVYRTSYYHKLLKLSKKSSWHTKSEFEFMIFLFKSNWISPVISSSKPLSDLYDPFKISSSVYGSIQHIWLLGRISWMPTSLHFKPNICIWNYDFSKFVKLSLSYILLSGTHPSFCI